MNTINLSVMYRPVKIGFLVEYGDIDSLVRTVGMNNLLWGGIYNPIIPVSKNSTFAEKIMKLFSVDVLCPISQTPAWLVVVSRVSRDRHLFLLTSLLQDDRKRLN